MPRIRKESIHILIKKQAQNQDSGIFFFLLGLSHSTQKFLLTESETRDFQRLSENTLTKLPAEWVQCRKPTSPFKQSNTELAKGPLKLKKINKTTDKLIFWGQRTADYGANGYLLVLREPGNHPPVCVPRNITLPQPGLPARGHFWQGQGGAEPADALGCLSEGPTSTSHFSAWCPTLLLFGFKHGVHHQEATGGFLLSCQSLCPVCNRDLVLGYVKSSCCTAELLTQRQTGKKHLIFFFK